MSALETQSKKPTSQESFAVEQYRKDFPILHQQVNGHPLVYLDNAASAQKPKQVIDTLSDYYQHTHANIHRGVHHLSEKATVAFEKARKRIQTFINARYEEEIIFLRGATEAINLVAHSYGHSQIGEGDEILISQMEHHSNIVPWQLLAEQVGAKIKMIPLHQSGDISCDEIEALISPRTKMLAITHISNALGTVNPIKKIIDIAHQHNVPVLIDGAQAAPHVKLDMQALDCDFYAISGHKLFGPTGIGVLYGKRELLEKMPPYQGGGEMIRRVSFEKTEFNELPHKFEAGTPHIAGVIGLAAAIDYIDTIGLDNIAAYEHELLEYATELAKQQADLTIIGNAKQKASILSFTLADIHAHDIGTILDQQGIAIRTGHHCAMPAMTFYQVAATARASFAFYNTREEIDALFTALQQVREVFK